MEFIIFQGPDQSKVTAANTQNTSKPVKTSSRIMKNNLNYSIVTTTSAPCKPDVDKKPGGKFLDRSLPPTPPPEPTEPRSTIWDSSVANVSLVNIKNNNIKSSTKVTEELKTYPWYRACDRKQAETLLRKCKNKKFIF